MGDVAVRVERDGLRVGAPVAHTASVGARVGSHLRGERIIPQAGRTAPTGLYWLPPLGFSIFFMTASSIFLRLSVSAV
jgi:hypothetical protein